MTDKEKFEKSKKDRDNKKNKLRTLQFLKSTVNRKLRFPSSLSEEEHGDLLVQLRDIEINTTRIIRNKYNSKAYEFTPSNKVY